MEVTNYIFCLELYSYVIVVFKVTKKMSWSELKLLFVREDHFGSELIGMAAENILCVYSSVLLKAEVTSGLLFRLLCSLSDRLS